MYTIVLAAGKTDYRDKSQGLSGSRHLTLVNGRPAIAWVIGDILKKTNDVILLVVDINDLELQKFCNIHYKYFHRVQIYHTPEYGSIVNSVLSAVNELQKINLNKDTHIRIVLGDTYLIDEQYASGDLVYVSDYSFGSSEWCVATVNHDKSISNYTNKEYGIKSESSFALVGRYEFSSAQSLIDAVRWTAAQSKIHLSDILERYSMEHPLHAQKISEKIWIDFGHLEGLAKARSRLVESRSFNRLVIDPLLPEITKHSKDATKLECEALWYERLPWEIQSLAPQVLSRMNGILTLEYYGYGTLAEKFLYADLRDGFWAYVLDRLFAVVQKFKSFPASLSKGLEGLYRTKTYQRLEILRKDPFWCNLLHMPRMIINEKAMYGFQTMQERIDKVLHLLCAYPNLSIMHGDLCFNNILYDVHSGIIKLIDPRGNIDGTPSLYGDPRYDIAKLRHSFCGNYDIIVEGEFEVSYAGSNEFYVDIFCKANLSEREKIFDDICIRYGYDIRQIKFIEALLFLTMIPLHEDSQQKQLCFFLSAIQKFNDCLEG